MPDGGIDGHLAATGRAQQHSLVQAGSGQP
jgi:hypothetical protein